MGKEIKPVRYTDEWGDEFDLVFWRDVCRGGCVYIGAISNEQGHWEEYCDVTVHVVPLPSGMACLDTNNAKGVCDFLIERGDATIMGSERSGFCEYPIASFTCGFLESLPTWDELCEWVQGGAAA